jgi:hypothetical protein
MMVTTSRIGNTPRRAILASVLSVILLVQVVAAGKDNAVQAQQPAPDPQQTVANLVTDWLGYLSNESVSGLTSLYATQAVLVWAGTVGIFGGGEFTGQGNVRLLYSALFENTTLLTAIASPVNTTLVTASTVNATFGLTLNTQRGSEGTYSFDINVEQRWADENGTWKIQDETWINNGYDFNAVTSTATETLALGPQWAVTSPPPFGPPNGVSGESCVTYDDFLYCVGGAFAGASVYYAQLGLDGGVGPWKNTTAYPAPVEGESCVAYTISAMANATILCVGGSNPDGSGPTRHTYIAQLSPEGGVVGPWQPQFDYPVPISGADCVVDSGIDGYTAVQMICVGGDTGEGNPTSAVYYARVWQDGSGDWNSTTPYAAAIDSHSCVISQVYVYCIGGLVNHSFTDNVYYAQVSSGGGLAGGWNETEPYPMKVTNADCVTSGGYDDYAFCIGGLVPGGGGTGDVFYARLSHTGGGIQGSWMRATSFDGGFDYNSCVEAISTIWCDAGGSLVYDEILGPDAPTVTQTVTVASATATVTITSPATSQTAASGQVTRGSNLPEVYGLFGIALIFAISTVFFATRRRS